MHRAVDVPKTAIEVKYDVLPWRFVWYSPTRSTQLGIISDEAKIAIAGFNVEALTKTPFGRGPSRPQIQADSRPVIMISE